MSLAVHNAKLFSNLFSSVFSESLLLGFLVGRILPSGHGSPTDCAAGLRCSCLLCALVRRGPDHLGENMKTFTKGYYLKEYRIVDNVMAKELADLTMMVEEDDWFD